MVSEAEVLAAARNLILSSPSLLTQYDDLPPHRQEVWRMRARSALQAAELVRNNARPGGLPHEHEAWQIREEDGGRYCAACGEWIDRPGPHSA